LIKTAYFAENEKNIKKNENNFDDDDLNRDEGFF